LKVEALDTLVEEEQKRLLVEFSNYENSVAFLAAVEKWFRWTYERSVKKGSSRLIDFDRFPAYAGNKPDFLVRFDPPYTLCGEHKLHFKLENKISEESAAQIVRYALRPPVLKKGEPYDVVVFTLMESDDVAVGAIRKEISRLGADSRPTSPIVVLGYYRDEDTASIEKWYKVKWRDSKGNARFSEPNAAPTGHDSNLNNQLLRQPHMSMRIERESLTLAARAPVINDEVPALYALVRVILPAVNGRMTDVERDMLASEGRLEKLVTVAEICAQPPMARIGEVGARGVRNALEALRKTSLCTRVAQDSADSYRLPLTRESFRTDPKDYYAKKLAEARVRKSRAGRALLESSNLNGTAVQPRLFDVGGH